MGALWGVVVVLNLVLLSLSLSLANVSRASFRGRRPVPSRPAPPRATCRRGPGRAGTRAAAATLAHADDKIVIDRVSSYY